VFFSWKQAIKTQQSGVTTVPTASQQLQNYAYIVLTNELESGKLKMAVGFFAAGGQTNTFLQFKLYLGRRVYTVSAYLRVSTTEFGSGSGLCDLILKEPQFLNIGK